MSDRKIDKRSIFVFGFEGTINYFIIWLHGQAVKTSPFHGGNTGSIPVGVIMASWLSWLERRPVTAEVVGSSPIGVVSMKSEISCRKNIWDLSSAGRASALQAEGHRFEPYRSHFIGFSTFQD